MYWILNGKQFVGNAGNFFYIRFSAIFLGLIILSTFFSQRKLIYIFHITITYGDVVDEYISN